MYPMVAMPSQAPLIRAAMGWPWAINALVAPGWETADNLFGNQHSLKYSTHRQVMLGNLVEATLLMLAIVSLKED